MLTDYEIYVLSGTGTSDTWARSYIEKLQLQIVLRLLEVI